MRAEDRPEDREKQSKGKATAKNIEGKLQEALGHITGDPEDKIKGKAKQAEATAMHARGDIRQDVPPGQASISEPTPGQPSYGTSDPYNSPQNVTPGQATMPAVTPGQPSYGTSDPYNSPQGTPGQVPGASATPGQPGYGTSDRDPYSQDVTPGRAAMPGATPGQPGYGTSDPSYSQGTPLGQGLATGPAPGQPSPGLGGDPYNNPQDVSRGQGPIENITGKIQEAAGRLTGDPEDQAKGRAKQDVPPGQGPMSGPAPGQPGYDQYPR